MIFEEIVPESEYKPLSSLLDFIVDNRGKTVPTADSGIPLIATNCIKNSELYPTYERVRYVTKDIYNKWFRSHPIPGDIIFVNKGKPGSVVMAPDPVDFCIAQDMMAFRVKKHMVYNKYLFAVLRSSIFQTQIMNYHVGTMIPHFKKGDLNKLLIPLPEMKVQKSIGDFYYNFSLKIEVNNLINKTLEDMAQAIFKRWFVDFEFPNEDGEPYKSSGGEMVESELGMIPKGWELNALYDLGEYINGTSFKKAEKGAFSSIPIIKIAEIKNGYSGQTEYLIESNNKDDKLFLKSKDILFSWSGNPETSIDIFLWPKDEGILNQHIFRVNPSNVEKSVLFFLLKSFKETFTQIASNKQTTGLGHVTIRDLKRLKIALPPQDIMNEYAVISNPIFQTLFIKLVENERLMIIRDSFLPKLMSGEIRVPIEES